MEVSRVGVRRTASGTCAAARGSMAPSSAPRFKPGDVPRSSASSRASLRIRIVFRGSAWWMGTRAKAGSARVRGTARRYPPRRATAQERKYSKWQFEGGCQAEKRGAKDFLGSEETRPYLSRSADSTFSSSNDLLRCSLKPARGGRKKGEIRPSVPRRASSTSSSGRLIVSRSVVAHERPTGRGRGPRVGHGPDPTETPALYAVPHAPGVTPGV